MQVKHQVNSNCTNCVHCCGTSWTSGTGGWILIATKRNAKKAQEHLTMDKGAFSPNRQTFLPKERFLGMLKSGSDMDRIEWGCKKPSTSTTSLFGPGNFFDPCCLATDRHTGPYRSGKAVLSGAEGGSQGRFGGIAHPCLTRVAWASTNGPLFLVASCYY